MEALAIVALGSVLGGFVQGLSGFAFGLVAMSVWAWALEPRVAVVLVVFGSLCGHVVSALSVRRGVSWRLLWPYLVGGLVGIPIGVAMVPWMNPAWFKLVVGALLVLWCPAMLWAGRLPRIRAGGRMADGGAGLAGGVMGGLAGLSGPVPTLWCTLRGYDKPAHRSVVQYFNFAVQAAVMAAYLASGLVTRDVLPMFAVVAPALLLPTVLGSRLYVGISDQAFQRIVLGLLTLSGAAMLASSLPVLLA